MQNNGSQPKDSSPSSLQIAARLATGLMTGGLLFTAFFLKQSDPLHLFAGGAAIGGVAALLTCRFPQTQIVWNLAMAGMCNSMIGAGVDVPHPSPNTFFAGVAIGAIISMFRRNWQIVLFTILVLFSALLAIVPGEVIRTSYGWMFYGSYSPLLFAMLVYSLSFLLISLL
jgi:hypothetical protein